MFAYSNLPGDGALIFLHNFRCAGNTVTGILSEEFGPDAIFRYGALGDEVADFNDFLTAARSGHHRLYLGHFCFGVHRHVPAPVTYITNVRDPVDRVLSHYAVQNSVRPCSLDDWLDNEFDARNGMVKRLCGFGYKEGEEKPHDFVTGRTLPRGFEVDDGHYRQAVENVESWDMQVIVQDLLVESLSLLQRRLGCRPLFSLFRQRYNQFPGKPAAAAQISRIEDINRLDRKLYGRLWARATEYIAAQGSGFQEDVLVLKTLDRIVSQPGVNALGLDELMERLDAALSLLVQDRQFALVANLLKLILIKPNLHRQVWINSARLLREIGQTEAADVIRATYSVRFGEPFPG